MPKSKAKQGETVVFEIGVKNRKPYIVEADAWSFGGYSEHAIFTLWGELVLVVAHQKWDYIRRMRPLVGEEKADANQR